MTLINEGLGEDAILTDGLGEFEELTIELAQRLIDQRYRRRGSSSKREDLDYEVTIGTRVLLINGIEPPNAVKGFVTVLIERDKRPKVTLVESPSNPSLDSVVIRVKRLKWKLLN